MENGCKKILVVFICMLFVVVLAVNAQAGQTEAAKTVKTLNDAILKAMENAKTLGFQGRYELFEPVISETFALSFMAQRTVGRYWNSFSESQKQLFFDTYKKLSVSSYASNFDSFNNEYFDIPESDIKSKGSVVIVPAFLKRVGKKDVRFLYKLKEFEGKWYIVDIHTSGVSQLALTRSQYSSVLKEKGFDALISSMNEKISSLSQKTK